MQSTILSTVYIWIFYGLNTNVLRRRVKERVSTMAVTSISSNNNLENSLVPNTLRILCKRVHGESMHLYDGQAVLKSVQFSLTLQRFLQNSSAFWLRPSSCCWGRSSGGSGRAAGYPRRCHDGGRGYGQASKMLHLKLLY